MLESTPQLCLQLYILLSTLKPSWTATFSMATSAIALSLPSIEKFLDSRHNNDEVKKMLVYYPIFLLNSIFKVAALSLIFVFFQIMSLLIFLPIALLNMVIGGQIRGRHFLLNEKSYDLSQQAMEMIMSFFTLTNLQSTRVAGLYRLRNIYMCFVSKSIILVTIVAICTIDPTGVSIPGLTGDTIWANLPIVENIFYLDLAVGLTLGCGMVSLIVDMLYNKLGYGAVFHEYWNEFTSLAREEAKKNRIANRALRKEIRRKRKKCVCCGIVCCWRSHQLKEDFDENVTVQLESLELNESRSKDIQHEQQTDGNNSQTLEMPEELWRTSPHLQLMKSTREYEHFVLKIGL